MRKQRFSLSSIFFCVFYIAAVLLAAAMVSTKGIDISTDLMTLLPTNGIPEGHSKAEMQIAARQNDSVNIFVSHEDFNKAKEGAELLSSQLESDGILLPSEGISFDVSQFAPVLGRYRYQLLDEDTVSRIAENPGSFQAESLSRIFSTFSLSSMDTLDEDPFQLDSIMLSRLIAMASSLSPFMPKDGVLSAEEDGIWYVLLQRRIAPEHLDISNAGGSGISIIYEKGDALEESIPGLSVYYSGLPFHSYESASSAQREITIITTASLLLIMLMFIILFRNIHVVGLFLISTFFSFLSAGAVILIFFREIHILTLIFGTTLIGTSIDYAIHYYLAYAKRGEGEGAGDVSLKLGRNLLTSFLSTVLCYLLILFSPYSILRQVALFSSAGLFGAYITVRGFFPVIIRPWMVKSNALAFRLPGMRPHRSYIPLLLIASALIFITALPKAVIHNDITRFYTMSPRLLESEMTAGKIMGYTSVSYTIIEGEDEHDAREKDASYSKALDQLAEEGAITGHLSLSSFLPAPSMQERSHDASMALIPLVESQCRAIGIDSGKAMDAISAPLDIADLEDLPEPIKAMLSQLVPGEIDGKFYIASMLFGVSDGAAVREMTMDHDGAFYFQKSTDISMQLDMLTSSILSIFAIASAAIFILLAVMYGRRGLALFSSPLIIIMSTIGIVVWTGMDLDFFFAVGLLLVIGLGLDYMVFASSSGEKPIMAITLSYATTALSFGTLLFSSFGPVHIFGVVVFIGITAAYIAALGAGYRRE